MLEKALIQSDSDIWIKKMTGKPSFMYVATEVLSHINQQVILNKIEDKPSFDGQFDFCYGEYIFCIEYDCNYGDVSYLSPQLNKGTDEENYCSWTAEDFNKYCQPDINT